LRRATSAFSRSPRPATFPIKRKCRDALGNNHRNRPHCKSGVRLSRNRALLLGRNFGAGWAQGPCCRDRIRREQGERTIDSARLKCVHQLARALEIPSWQLMLDGNEPPAPIKITKPRKAEDEWQSSSSGSKAMHQLIPLLKKTSTPDRTLIPLRAGKTARGQLRK
jgi:hypothetical protein